MIPKRARQFSLRAFLLLLTVFAVWLGAVANHAHRKRLTAAIVSQVGGSIHYSHQVEFNEEIGELRVNFDKLETPGPVWLRRLVGDDYFREPAWIRVGGGVTDDWLIEHAPLMARLPELRLFRLGSGHRATPKGLAYLGKLQQLHELWIYTTPTSDESLAHFGRLENLRQLCLGGGPGITDEGLRHLARLTRLEVLAILNGPAITDQGLEHLKTLGNLKRLRLRGTCVTPEAAARLQTVLPRCHTIYLDDKLLPGPNIPVYELEIYQAQLDFAQDQLDLAQD